MSVPAGQPNRYVYNGDGSSTSFAVNSVFENGSDLLVYTWDTVALTASLKVLGTDYTVSGGSGSTGTVVFASAPASTLKVVIVIAPVPSQAQNISFGGALPPTQYLYGLDFLTILVRRLNELLTRSVAMQDYDPSTFDPRLPTSLAPGDMLAVNSSGTSFVGGFPAKGTRASMLLGFDINGLPIAVAPSTGGTLIAVKLPAFVDDATYAATYGSPVQGAEYYNTTISQIKIYTGSVWVQVPTGTIPVSGGGTGQTATPTVASASAFAAWDASVNLPANNFLRAFLSTATAAGTTTLVVGSAAVQVFTGATTQTVVLPDVTTLKLGHTFTIVNLSSGAVTVQSSGGNTVQVLPANTQLVVTCQAITGTGTASWLWAYAPVQSSATPIAAGGTGVTAIPASPAASAFAAWDANKNLTANNLIDGFATTATAGATTALTVASASIQVFTGTLNQTVTLPVVSGLQTGQQFTIINLSSGTVTVQSSGGNTLQVLAANTQLVVICQLTSGTGTASWTWAYGPVQSGLLGIAQGGTGQSTAAAAFDALSPNTTKGDLAVRGASSNTRLGVGSDGQVLTADSTQPTGVKWGAGASVVFTAPQMSKLVSPGTGFGYVFTVLRMTAVVGDTYTNNGNTYTVLASVTNAGLLWCSGSGTPLASGTLTRASGTGDATGTFTDRMAMGTPAGFLFTVTSANATVGATYTNNGNTFTVANTIAGLTALFCTGSSWPAVSGTLTKASGTGDATIAFSAIQPLATYTPPGSTLSLEIEMVGGGGGGGASATNSGFAGGISAFGPNLLIANGGNGGSSSSDVGGDGGTTVVNASGCMGFTGGKGGTGAGAGATNVGATMGAASPFGGAGSGTQTTGSSASSNTGSGGGGSSSGSNAVGAGGAGGYIKGIITSIAGSYLYAVAPSGAGGAPGTNGGGTGGSGIILVRANFQ